MALQLEYTLEDGRVRRVPIGPNHTPLVIGRLAECELRTANRTVSRRHAELTFASGAVQVRDLGSTAGTWLRGKQVDRATLHVGDAINFGKVVVTVVGEAPGTAPVPDEYATPFGDPIDDGFDDAGGDDPNIANGGAGTMVLEEFSSEADGDDDDDGDDQSWPPKRSSKKKRSTAPNNAPVPRPAAAEEEPEVAADDGLTLTWCDEDGQTNEFVLSSATGEVTAGRGRNATVKLRHATVSRQHAKLWLRDGMVLVTDLNSSTGTWVDGEQIRRIEVAPGQTFSCGKVEVRVASPGDDHAEEPAAAPVTIRWEIRCELPDGDSVRYLLEEGQGAVVIGRNPDVDLRIRGAGTVGRRHCQLQIRDGQLFVRDLASTNGTLLDDVRLEAETELSDGDELLLGTFPITVGLLREGGIEDWEDQWGEGYDDVEEMTPPPWHVLWTDDEGAVQLETLGPERRLVAAGADGECEINASDRGMEADHCEITWEDGALVVRDLETNVGTMVRNRPVTRDRVLKNGDAIHCGEFVMQVVRGAAVDKVKANSSADAETWGRRLKARPASLCVVFADSDDGSGTRHELTLWSDGEGKIEHIGETAGEAVTARVSEDVTGRIFDGLIAAGFPDAPRDDDEAPVEIAAYLDEYEVAAMLGAEALYRSEPYHEAVAILRACVASFVSD